MYSQEAQDDSALLHALGAMGKKHSKNAETRGWYSAAEKKRDTAQSSWGTQAMRLSADSVVDWDCCCLSTARPSDPVVTPDGFLFNRESLLEYMLAARQAGARKLKEWEDQMGAILKKGQVDAEQEQRKLVQVHCATAKKIHLHPSLLFAERSDNFYRDCIALLYVKRSLMQISSGF